MKQDDEEIPEATIKKAEELYRKALPDLTLTSNIKGAEREEMLAELRKQLLLFVKYSEAEISRLGDLSAIPQDKFEQLLDRKRGEALGLNGNSQKIVSMSELKPLILEGWEFVSSLPGNEAIVRLPSHNGNRGFAGPRALPQGVESTISNTRAKPRKRSSTF